jgi:hypothetical protein
MARNKTMHSSAINRRNTRHTGYLTIRVIGKGIERG